MRAPHPLADRAAVVQPTAARPDIVDRNGELLVASVKTSSIFAEPRKILDPDEASELLSAALPNVSAESLRATLASKKKGFAWIARHVTPQQQAEVFRLGIPGVGEDGQIERAIYARYCQEAEPEILADYERRHDVAKRLSAEAVAELLNTASIPTDKPKGSPFE